LDAHRGDKEGKFWMTSLLSRVRIRNDMESQGTTISVNNPPEQVNSTPQQDVFERLLLAKALLSEISVVPTVRPDSLTTARYVLIAHDAAELVLAAITRHLQCTITDRAHLMDYAGAIGKETEQDIPHRNFFSDLNRQRANVKHHGLMPNVEQWGNVAEAAYQNISSVCEKYLSIRLDQLDESILVQHEGAKRLIAEAKAAYQGKDYQHVLEKLAHTLFVLFKDNRALRNMTIGKPHAEDAIKLTAFGVNANEFLALQEFLPSVNEDGGNVSFRWDQEEHGHPGNWTSRAADFCLKTVVHVAVRIQNATWIPSAIEFLYVYEHKVTALEDNVEIVQPGEMIGGGALSALLSPPTKPVVVRTLSKGESIVGMVHRNKRDGLLSALGGRQESGPETLSFSTYGPDRCWGDMEASKVLVTCVPRENEFVRKYYPHLHEMSWNG